MKKLNLVIYVLKQKIKTVQVFALLAPYMYVRSLWSMLFEDEPDKKK